jgi:hypothetical protein
MVRSLHFASAAFLAGGLALQAGVPPARAALPTASASINQNKVEKYKALQAQDRMHDRMRQKVRAASRGKGGCSAGPAPVPAARASTGKVPGFRLPSLLPVVKSGFLLLALAGGPDLLGCQAQPGSGLALLFRSSLNMTTPNPVNLAVAAGANLALGNANASGLLPPWGALVPGPMGTLLASPPPLSVAPVGADPLPYQLGTVAYSNQAEHYALNAAIHAMNAFELYTAGRIIQGVGHQLIADSALAEIASQNVSAALKAAGNNLVSMGDFFQAAAAVEEVEAADDVIVGVTAKEQKEQDKARPDAANGTGGDREAQRTPWNPLALAGAVDPDLCYGTWQSIDTQIAQQYILYKVSRAEFVKFNVTTRNGRPSVHSEYEPGKVRCQVASDFPEQGASASGSQPNTRVTMLVDRACGETLVLAFAFLRAEPGTGTGEAVDVLVEREGERKAFVRVAEF